MYIAKLEVATGAFRLKKRGHKHHEQFTKERSIELLLCHATNLPSMDGNKAKNDPYVDVRLGEAEHDYRQKGDGLGVKKYCPSQFRGTPDCNESAALHSYGLDAHCC